MNQIYQPTVIRANTFNDLVVIVGQLTIVISDSTLDNWVDSGALNNNYTSF